MWSMSGGPRSVKVQHAGLIQFPVAFSQVGGMISAGLLYFSKHHVNKMNVLTWIYVQCMCGTQSCHNLSIKREQPHCTGLYCGNNDTQLLTLFIVSLMVLSDRRCSGSGSDFVLDSQNLSCVFTPV